MGKYTIEQLRTKGTSIKVVKGMKWHCDQWSQNNEYSIFTKGYEEAQVNLISHGSMIWKNNEEHIIIDVPNRKSYFFLVPISEFERLGMLKSEEKKYTVEYCKNNKVAIKVNSREECIDLLHYFCNVYITDSVACHRFNDNNTNYILGEGGWYKDRGYEIINYQTFIEHNKQEKMNEIPQYFCVKNDGTEEFKQYIEWLNNKYEVCYGGYYENYYYGYDGSSVNKGTYLTSDKNDFKNNPIVFESAKEFMELVNKTNKNNTMEKPQTFKILGKEHQLKAIWQDLMDMGYENGTMNNEWKAISQLRENRDFKTLTYSCNVNWLNVTFNLPQDYSKALEHAQKCLELLKPKEIIHSVGSKFDVKIKDGKIYHENSDITRFVKEMVDHFIPDGDNVIGFGGFFAKIKEVEFESTGCQKAVTKLSDWVELWNKYKEITK